ncbi:MAG: hypothetical protein CMO34_00705 [Verrucomicrobia bacterium]|nr:hypothetical protein [Verrucomicrobiota bacterium]
MTATKRLSVNQIIWLFIGCGFLLYGNTLGHDFALDDALVYTDNAYTKKGFSGIWEQLSNDQFMGFYGEKKDLVSGGRYRPLSMVMFNMQYALNGESAFLGHLTNVLFYILNGILLYLVLRKLLSTRNITSPIPYLDFPLLISMIWFFHPIHTEVVANIKGLDEMMAFTFELITLLLLLDYLKTKSLAVLFGLSATFFLALLSKENAVTWLAVLPLTIYFFTEESFKKALPAYAAVLVSFGIWFIIRYQVIGGGITAVADNLMNDPFLESSMSEKYATIVLTLGKYLQLMVYPHPLTYDYYPKHIPIVSWGHPMVLLSLASHLFLIFVLVKGFIKKHFLSYSILIYSVTLSIASNLFFPIGAFMNERFIYVSSLGFAIALSYFLLQILPKKIKHKKQQTNFISGFAFTVLILFSVKVISRNPVWKNNFTLSTHDANISINGAKSNVMAGGLLTERAQETTDPIQKKAYLERALLHLNRAINIYPDYIDAYLLMGNAQWDYSQQAEKAIPYYLQILSINPRHENAWQNIYIVLEQSKNADYKIGTYKNLMRINPNDPKLYLNLGRAYGKDKNDLQNSITTMEEGLERFPREFELLSNLGTAYGILGDYSKALGVLLRAKELQANNANVHVNLGLSYYYTGQLELAQQAFDEAKRLNPQIDRNQFPI